jgi:hypothetical protein
MTPIEISSTNITAIKLHQVTYGTVPEGGTVRFELALPKSLGCEIEVVASRLSSQLDPVVRILNEQGGEIAYSDDSPSGGRDSLPSLTASVVLTTATERIDFSKDGEAKIKIACKRYDYDGPVKLEADSLPAGVSFVDDVIPAKKNEGELTLKRDKPINAFKVRIHGSIEAKESNKDLFFVCPLFGNYLRCKGSLARPWTDGSPSTLHLRSQGNSPVRFGRVS